MSKVVGSRFGIILNKVISHSHRLDPDTRVKIEKVSGSQIEGIYWDIKDESRISRVNVTFDIPNGIYSMVIKSPNGNKSIHDNMQIRYVKGLREQISNLFSQEQVANA